MSDSQASESNPMGGVGEVLGTISSYKLPGPPILNAFRIGSADRSVGCLPGYRGDSIYSGGVSQLSSSCGED